MRGSPLRIYPTPTLSNRLLIRNGSAGGEDRRPGRKSSARKSARKKYGRLLGAASPRRLFALGDEALHFRGHGRNGGDAQGEQMVVESPDVEVGAELGLGLAARAHDVGFAQLVGQGLPRPGDVPVDLGADLMV